MRPKDPNHHTSQRYLQKVKDPVARMTNIVIEVHAPVELSKEQRKGD